MFFAVVFASLFVQPAAPVEDMALAAQRAKADALQAEHVFIEAGDAYVALADMPGADRREAFDLAHVSFDDAYVTTQDWRPLCRALEIAELVLHEDNFKNAEERIAWQDVSTDDQARLRQDAADTKRANCRYYATGALRGPKVARIDDDDDDDPSPTTHLLAALEGDAEVSDSGVFDVGVGRRAARGQRRARAHTAMGGILTGMGIGFLGLMAGALEGQRRYSVTMRSMNERAETEGRDFTSAEQSVFDRAYQEARELRGVAIGVGLSGGAALVTGITLLATRNRAARALAVLPYGGFSGAGATLRLKF